ncbi:MAG: hypothetical protein ACRDEB_04655, partial [Chitinophagaceae bacterium]
MKKILLATSVFLLSLIGSAQYNTTLVVSVNPPGSLLSWSIKDLTYIISGSAGVAGQVVIKATLKTSDGTVAATTNLAKARAITINPAAGTILYAADVIPLEIMIFNGKFKTSLDRSGKLPAGGYELCVQLVSPGTFQRLSEERCRSFNIASFQLAIPIMPFYEQVLKPELAQTAITFRWAPVSPAPSTPVTYRILVFEVLENQTPMQALRSNQPLLNKDVIGTTQFIWQPQMMMMPCNPCPDMQPDMDSARAVNSGKNIPVNNTRNKKTFIWTLQCLDNIGNPIGDGAINGDGISEPSIF